MNKQFDPDTHHFTTIYLTDGMAKNDDDESVPRIAEFNIVIYPINDDGFQEGFADDIYVEEIRTGKYHLASVNLTSFVIGELSKRPDEWLEIRTKGEANGKAMTEGELAELWKQ